jgi:hypothetical protein
MTVREILSRQSGSGALRGKIVKTFAHFSGLNESDAFLRTECQSLAMQPWKLQRNPKPFAIPKIEGDNFVLGDAIEIAIGTKAKTARPAKFDQPFGGKTRTRCLSAASYSRTARHWTLQMDTR